VWIDVGDGVPLSVVSSRVFQHPKYARDDDDGVTVDEEITWECDKERQPRMSYVRTPKLVKRESTFVQWKKECGGGGVQSNVQVGQRNACRDSRHLPPRRVRYLLVGAARRLKTGCDIHGRDARPFAGRPVLGHLLLDSASTSRRPPEKRK
jgi:hypothetical protein